MKKFKWAFPLLTFLALMGGFLVTNKAAYAAEAAVCPPTANPQQVRCLAHAVIDSSGHFKASSTPTGYGPAQFLKAYNLPSTAAKPQIIAVVLALDDPNIKKDLDTFSATIGIPTLPDCVGSIKSSTVPCFQKLDQRGGTNFPTVVDPLFALEMSLDVETAHGICQDCSILLEEGDEATLPSIFTAFDQAVAQGATVISNSYGAPEFAGETSFDSHFNHPGLAITFASGDSGFGAFYPAASQFVTAVGGTTLNLNPDNSYASESAWKFGGSGCSPYEPKPSWQHDTGCANRTVADVAANSDPDTGAAIYDSLPINGQSGWFKVGGTSAAAPLIAGVYGLSGKVMPQSAFGSSLPYANPSGLRDITTGSNANNGHCMASYLCTALPGYDGPTGLGTPNGLASF